MKQKSQKLSDTVPYNFDLIGIVSSAKEYKLGWHLNQLNEFHLVKDKDLILEFKNQQQISISVLSYLSEFRKVHMLKNRVISSTIPDQNFMLQELQQFDFLLKLSNETNENWCRDLNNLLKSVPVIDYSVILDVSKLKMKEYLLF